jgi:hypothetical protein
MKIGNLLNAGTVITDVREANKSEVLAELAGHAATGEYAGPPQARASKAIASRE